MHGVWMLRYSVVTASVAANRRNHFALSGMDERRSRSATQRRKPDIVIG